MVNVPEPVFLNLPLEPELLPTAFIVAETLLSDERFKFNTEENIKSIFVFEKYAPH